VIQSVAIPTVFSKNILFFSIFWGGNARAAAVPVDTNTLGEQPAIICQRVAYFLNNPRDIVHFAKVNRNIHSALRSTLRGFHIEHNTGEYKLEWQPERRFVVRNFDLFVKQAREYIKTNLKKDWGLKLSLAHCCLGQMVASDVLARLSQIVNDCECEIVRLDLSHNQLKEIPKEVYQMKFLKTLLLGSNPIQYYPGMFRGMPTIKNLDLMHTFMTQIPEGLFDGLEQVSLLNLYMNNLPTISLKSLHGLVALKTLDLTQTGIRNIEFDSEMSKWFPSLEMIDVTNKDTAELEAQLRNLNNCQFELDHDEKKSIVILKRKKPECQKEKKDYGCCLS